MGTVYDTKNPESKHAMTLSCKIIVLRFSYFLLIINNRIAEYLNM